MQRAELSNRLRKNNINRILCLWNTIRIDKVSAMFHSYLTVSVAGLTLLAINVALKADQHCKETFFHLVEEGTVYN